jgi:hypothetical protein
MSVNQQAPAATSLAKKFRRELKTVRLTAGVVGAFIVLWTPYTVGRFIQVRGSSPLLAQYVSDIGMALGNFNSCINWMIYGLASSEFRKAVCSLLMSVQPPRCFGS